MLQNFSLTPAFRPQLHRFDPQGEEDVAGTEKPYDGERHLRGPESRVDQERRTSAAAGSLVAVTMGSMADQKPTLEYARLMPVRRSREWVGKLAVGILTVVAIVTGDIGINTQSDALIFIGLVLLVVAISMMVIVLALSLRSR